MDNVVRIFLLVSALVAGTFTSVVPAHAGDAGYMDETYRPQYHYTAEKNMINDPNGLVYLDGEYHLFHQYNLHDAVHWGHAVSTDLVHWKHLEPALLPDAIGQIFSGSIVVDTANTSGFATGTGPVLVAAFTYGEHNLGPQSQGIAYSNDKGRTWTMYEGNPVMPNEDKPDFRDPKVFWHESTEQWVMVLTAGKLLEFYTSPDLKTWAYASAFGATDPHPGNWECPDIFPMTDPTTGTTKWVLSVSVDKGAPNGGVGMQYFLGEFDGTTFTNDDPGAPPLWQNYGKDYYAGVTWNGIPEQDGRRLMIAWNDNWQYRFDPPTQPFNGQLSLVRELQLKHFPEGLRLVQNPVKEQESLRGTPQTWTNQTLSPGTNLLAGITGETVEVIAEFDAASATATEFGIKVRKGTTQSTPVGYDRTTSTMYVDRSNSGVIPNPGGFNPSTVWAGRHSAPLAPVNGKVALRIFVDRSSVEAFGNEREQISDLILPDRSSNALETYAIGGDVTLTSLTVYPLSRIWATTSPNASELGQWTSVQGEWADTREGREGSADGYGFSLSARTGSDLSLAADIKIQGVLPGNPKPIKLEAAAGLMLRADPKAKSGYLATLNAKTDSVDLIRIDGDDKVTVASTPLPLATNTNYRMSVTAEGEDITVSVDGDVLITAQDGTYRSGHTGLVVQDSAAFLQNITADVTTDFTTNLSGWSPRSGTWNYRPAGIEGTSSADAFLMSSQTATDFSYSADITVAANGGGRAGTLVFRSDDDASHAYGLNLDAGADVVTFFGWGSPGATIATYPVALSHGSTYRLGVQAVGSTFTFTLDGSPIGTATDTTYTTGKLGLNVYNSTTVLQNAIVKRINTGWTPVNGTWTSDGTGHQGSATGDGFLMSAQRSTNFSYGSTVTVNEEVGGHGAAALVFRANATASQGYVANIDALNDCVTLFRFNPDGSATTLARYAYSIDAGRAYDLDVMAQDQRLSVYVDGRKILDATDGTYTEGHTGLNVWNSSSSFTDTALAPDTNLLVNGGFEYGNLTGWTEWRPAGQAAAYGVDGWDTYQGAKKLYFYSGVPFQESVHQVATGMANGNYQIQARVKLSQAATIARLELTGHGGAAIDVNISPSGEYQLISATVPVTTGKLDVGFYLNAPGNTSLQIDSVALQKL